jgi:acylphosphatase
VSYRAETRREGRRLGVTGWVKNEPDGSVLLEAQGTGAQLDELLVWLKDGPPLAVVTSVDVGDVEPVAGEDDFDVRY